MNSYEITKIDLIILKDLIETDKISFIKSKPIYELKILQVSKHTTAYKRIQYLEKIGFIVKGLKDGREKYILHNKIRC